VDNSTDAVYWMGPDARFIYVNNAAVEALGYSKEELLTMTVHDIDPEFPVEVWPAHWVELKEKKSFVIHSTHQRKDESTYPVEITVNLIQFGGREINCAIAKDVTEHMQAEQQIIENQTQLKSLASELVLAEERERNRIAVHLHDEISQNLAYAKMKLQMLNESLDSQAQIDEMAEICGNLTRMMQDVQTLTFELSTPVLTELGLEAAVAHWLTEQIQEKHGITTVFTDDGRAKPLEEDIRALLFRSVRELLTNTVKHSQAKQVRVSISRAEDQILIRLEDDGIGFAPDEVVVGQESGGFGLFSIRERLSQMGGSLEIDSSPGQGCRSILRAPLLRL